MLMDKDTPVESLIDFVTNSLRSNGHPNPEAWKVGLHEDAYTTDNFGIQRFLVNRQLRLICGSAEANSMNVRYCLVEDGTYDDWTRLFNQMVMPFIIQHNLPLGCTVGISH